MKRTALIGILVVVPTYVSAQTCLEWETTRNSSECFAWETPNGAGGSAGGGANPCGAESTSGRGQITCLQTISPGGHPDGGGSAVEGVAAAMGFVGAAISSAASAVAGDVGNAIGAGLGAAAIGAYGLSNAADSGAIGDAAAAAGSVGAAGD